jgi:hypothetical protein
MRALVAPGYRSPSWLLSRPHWSGKSRVGPGCHKARLRRSTSIARRRRAGHPTARRPPVTGSRCDPVSRLGWATSASEIHTHSFTIGNIVIGLAQEVIQLLVDVSRGNCTSRFTGRLNIVLLRISGRCRASKPLTVSSNPSRPWQR